MKRWYPPPGHPGSQTRRWAEYRALVREAAARWCDKPIVTHEEEEAKMELCCEDCWACDARALIAEGEA